MNLTINQLATQLNGKVIGDADIQITHPAKIEEAKTGSISFLANMKYENHIYTTEASAVIVSKTFAPKEKLNTTLILVDEPYGAFVQVLNHFQGNHLKERGVHPMSYVHPTAQVHEDVYIGPFVSVGQGAVIEQGVYLASNCSIGEFATIQENTVLYANVSVYQHCKIGKNCIIHSNTVIGSDGFGFAPNEKGEFSKVPQIGNVEIHDNVEIGSNCSIDRATMGSTIIHNGVKIDNLVQIAHNVIIDSHTVIAAQVGISGSTKIGKHVFVGGQAGFVGHITVADKTKINAQSGVSKSIKKEGLALSGSPAFEWREELKAQSVFRKLPQIEQKIREIENRINPSKS